MKPTNHLFSFFPHQGSCTMKLNSSSELTVSPFSPLETDEFFEISTVN